MIYSLQFTLAEWSQLTRNWVFPLKLVREEKNWESSLYGAWWIGDKSTIESKDLRAESFIGIAWHSYILERNYSGIASSLYVRHPALTILPPVSRFAAPQKWAANPTSSHSIIVGNSAVIVLDILISERPRARKKPDLPLSWFGPCFPPLLLFIILDPLLFPALVSSRWLTDLI